jgi:hypothetical protein
VSGLGVLRPFAARAAAASAPPRCELCGEPIAPEHAHVADLEAQTLACACRACAVLFDRRVTGRHRTVPTRVRHDPAFVLTREVWDAVDVPVHLAFVSYATAAGRWVARVASPAGAVESKVDPDGWAALSALTPLVRCAEPDVEALLVYGRRTAERLTWMLVPIDVAYHLSASLRTHWRGFDGGDPARRHVDQLVAELRARSRPLSASELAAGAR